MARTTVLGGALLVLACGRPLAEREPAASGASTTPQAPSAAPSTNASVATSASSTEPPSPRAASVGRQAPGADSLGFESCTPKKHRGGELAAKDLPDLAEVLEKDLCYGYFHRDVTKKRLASSFQACATQAGSTAFEVRIGLTNDGTPHAGGDDGRGCTVLVNAASWDKRTFVRTVESYAATVEVAGGEKTIGVGERRAAFEVIEGRFVRVFSGQPCLALYDPKETLIGEVGAGFRKDWSSMPADLRDWFCQES